MSPRVDLAAEIRLAIDETQKATWQALDQYDAIVREDETLRAAKMAKLEELDKAPIGPVPLPACERFDALVLAHPRAWAARERFHALARVLESLEAKAKEGAK